MISNTQAKKAMKFLGWSLVEAGRTKYRMVRDAEPKKDQPSVYPFLAMAGALIDRSGR